MITNEAKTIILFYILLQNLLFTNCSKPEGSLHLKLLDSHEKLYANIQSAQKCKSTSNLHKENPANYPIHVSFYKSMTIR